MENARRWLDEEVRDFISTQDASSSWESRALYVDGTEDKPLSRSSLDSFIVQTLVGSLGHMRRQSYFYKHKLANFQDVLNVIEAGKHDLSTLMQLMDALPFTTSQELALGSEEFLSIGQSQVAGLISIPTSGTTGERKRVFCSQGDLERTIRFFQYGMRLILPQLEGQKVLLLMSGDREGSVGHLLQEGLGRWGIACEVYGFPMDMAHCLATINSARPSCLVGLPSHLMTLCRMGFAPETMQSLEAVLLSGEWTSPTILTCLEEGLRCPVYLHYGLTESGLAGAVECSERSGCHIREADILLSVVDKEGRPLVDGEWGEVILTTLTRQATPLLRYKTGDLGRIMPGVCPCGSVLKRLEAGERIQHRLILPSGKELGFGELDAALFSLPWLAGYSLRQEDGPQGQDTVSQTPWSDGQAGSQVDSQAGGSSQDEAMRQGDSIEPSAVPSSFSSPSPSLSSLSLSAPARLELHLDCTESFTARHESQARDALRSLSGEITFAERGEDAFRHSLGYGKGHEGLSIVLTARTLPIGTDGETAPDRFFGMASDIGTGIASHVALDLAPGETPSSSHCSSFRPACKSATGESGLHMSSIERGRIRDDGGASVELCHNGAPIDSGEAALDKALAVVKKSAEKQVHLGKRRMPPLPS